MYPCIHIGRFFNKSQSGSPGASPGCPSKDNGLHAAWGVSIIRLNGKPTIVHSIYFSKHKSPKSAFQVELSKLSLSSLAQIRLLVRPINFER